MSKVIYNNYTHWAVYIALTNFKRKFALNSNYKDVVKSLTTSDSMDVYNALNFCHQSVKNSVREFVNDSIKNILIKEK